MIKGMCGADGRSAHFGLSENLVEFAPAGAKKCEFVPRGDVHLARNTLCPAARIICAQPGAILLNREPNAMVRG